MRRIPTQVAFLLVLLSGAVEVDADNLIHESATLGPNPGGDGFSIIADAVSGQFLGSRFTITETRQVAAIGGEISSPFPGDHSIFGAIISLSGPNALPRGMVSNPNQVEDTLAPDEVVAATTFFVHSSSHNSRVPMRVTLPPGHYALVFGTGLFGATGRGHMPIDNPQLPGTSYFSWQKNALGPGQGRWLNNQGGLRNMRFVVYGNEDPIANAGPDQTVECGDLTSLAGSAFDSDRDDLTFRWDVPAGVMLDDPDRANPVGLFPMGVTTATLTVTDGQGGVDVDDVVITVVDTTPPEVACTTDFSALWPPNHQVVSVNLFVHATDACEAPEELILLAVEVSSDEPDNGLGDGDQPGDVDGQDSFTSPLDVSSTFVFNPITGGFEGTVFLRAERDGRGNGRAYQIEAFVRDTHDNLARSSCVVVVPHNRRK